MQNVILLAIGGIGFSLFIVYELSLAYGFLQVVGALSAMIGVALILNYLMKGKESSEDDFERAEKIAEEYVERKTGIKATYMRSKGTTVNFLGTDFFIFAVFREKYAKPYLMILKKKAGEKFKIHAHNEDPQPSIINEILGDNPTYSFLTGDPKYRILGGAPVAVDELLAKRRGNAPTNQIIVGSEKEDKEKRQDEKLGLK